MISWKKSPDSLPWRPLMTTHPLTTAASFASNFMLQKHGSSFFDCFPIHNSITTFCWCSLLPPGKPSSPFCLPNLYTNFWHLLCGSSDHPNTKVHYFMNVGVLQCFHNALNLPHCIIVPHSGLVPRHPSQITLKESVFPSPSYWWWFSDGQA